MLQLEAKNARRDLEHWRQEVGKKQSQIDRRDNEIATLRTVRDEYKRRQS